MPAPKGHPLWGNPLKPKKYTPDELWEGATDYFKWCDENPLILVEQTKAPQKLSNEIARLKPNLVKSFLKQTIDLPKQRAYSIERLCIFLNISRETFDNYSKADGYETYFDICLRIRQIIDSQHFEGGMAGLFNSNIVTRKLGLVEQQKTEHSGGVIVWNEEKTYEAKPETDQST